MKAVILAGGLGNRLKPFTEIIPKPLLPVGEKSVLEIQIEQLKKHGFTEIYLATNYRSEYFTSFFGDGSKYGVNIIISREEFPLGTAGPIKLLAGKLDEPFIVMNGDILTQLNFSDFYEFAIKKESELTIAVKKEVMPFEFGNIFFDGDLVTGIEEKPNYVSFILAGIYVMLPRVLNYIPENEYYGMDQLIKNILSLNKPIMKYVIEDYWLDIGRSKDYERAQEFYKNNNEENLIK